MMTVRPSGFCMSLASLARSLLGAMPTEQVMLDMQKPDGLTVIKPEDVPRIMERLPVKDLCGIGRKTERQLALMSIKTCGELGRCDEALEWMQRAVAEAAQANDADATRLKGEISKYESASCRPPWQ